LTSKKQPEPISVDVDFALARAASVLDEIMQMARDIKDPTSALEVVNGWFTLAALLDVDEDENTDESGKKHKTGFHHE
jgi:hypothetical protein